MSNITPATAGFKKNSTRPIITAPKVQERPLRKFDKNAEFNRTMTSKPFANLAAMLAAKNGGAA